MAIEFTLAADLAYADLAALLERVFASYLVLVRGVPRRVEARNRAEHVDLFASRIARRDGEPIALAMIARRGRRSRVAAMGVAARLVRGLAARFAPRPLVMPPIVPERLGGELAVHLGQAPYELEQVEMMHALAGRT